MLATPAPFFRWFGRSELSRDAVAGADTIRVSFQLRDSSPGSHEGRSRCEIKLWLEWFEIQAQACWALCSLKSGYVDGLIAGVTLTPRCLRHYTSKLTFLLSTWTLEQEQLRDTICFLTHSSCWAAHRPAETFKKLLSFFVFLHIPVTIWTIILQVFSSHKRGKLLHSCALNILPVISVGCERLL